MKRLIGRGNFRRQGLHYNTQKLFLSSAMPCLFVILEGNCLNGGVILKHATDPCPSVSVCVYMFITARDLLPVQVYYLNSDVLWSI